MKETVTLRFLYHTVPGRMLLKRLVSPGVSRLAGHFLSSGVSKWLVPYYIRKHAIDMSNIAIPPKGFSSFNDFFTRKKKHFSVASSEGRLLSPCDGFLTILDIRENIVFDIKNTRFSLEDLLKDSKLAAKFQNGLALIFRLTPANYHRYCYAADGRLLCHRKIHGKLHCVRPIALRTTPVFVQNSREYQVIQNKSLGTVVQMEVGALLVGKINNYRPESGSLQVQAGAEKGYFEFGGSTIILLLQKNAVCLNEKLYKRNQSDGEIKVRIGEYIAEALHS